MIDYYKLIIEHRKTTTMTTCSSARPSRQARRDAIEARRLSDMADHNNNQARRSKWIRDNPGKDLILCPF